MKFPFLENYKTGQITWYINRTYHVLSTDAFDAGRYKNCDALIYMTNGLERDSERLIKEAILDVNVVDDLRVRPKSLCF